jgi:hypothetical protein
LRDEDHSETRVADAADECETQGDGRVEKATADAEEDPSADRETESECQRDVQQRARGHHPSGIIDRIGFDCDLSTGEGEEEEEERAKELAERLRRVSDFMNGMSVMGRRARTATIWPRVGCGLPAGTSDGLRPTSAALRAVALGRTMNRSWTGGWTFMVAVAIVFGFSCFQDRFAEDVFSAEKAMRK